MPSVLDSSPGEGAPAPAVTDLLGRVGDLVKGLPEAIHRLLVEQVTELTADQQLRDLLSDTVAANVGTWLSVIRYSIPIDHVEAPTAALEHARRMAQREIPVNALLRAYRLGHQHGLNLIIAGLRSADLPPNRNWRSSSKSPVCRSATSTGCLNRCWRPTRSSARTGTTTGGVCVNKPSATSWTDATST